MTSNTNKVLANEALESFTVEATTIFVAEHDESINDVLLKDTRASVAAIPNPALPRQPAFKLYADEMAKRLGDVLANDVNITAKTIANKRAMIKLACVEALEARLVAEMATQRLAKATTKAQKASAEKAVAKAADTLANPPTSLHKASVAGRRIVDRKTSAVTGFAKQTAKNAAKAKARTAKPSKADEKIAADNRKAKKELILQALGNAKDTALDNDVTLELALVALRAVAHVADDIISFLPADMRTL